MPLNTHVHPEKTALTSLFGYFCVERDGLETILVRVEPDNRWALPINTEFNPCVQTAAQAIDAAVADFCERSGLLGRAELLASGLELPTIRRVLIGPTATGYDTEETKTGDVFFKIKLNEQIDLSNSDYTWELKTSLIPPNLERFDPGKCVDEKKIYAISRDFVDERFGFKILECVDIPVFRVKKDGQVEFLLLKRLDRRQGFVGWEYPKGGILFHETLYEGSMRELEEETGTTSFVYRGYLGYQIVDVSERGVKKYDTLRVHGVTFLFTGAEGTIRTEPPDEEFIASKWVSWGEAREMIWMKGYGPEFFDRWQAKRDQILAGLL